MPEPFAGDSPPYAVSAAHDTRPVLQRGLYLGAMASLTDGLTRLRESAVQLTRTDARDVIARFGQMGGRKLAAVG
jgi:hypothetical protein